MSTGRGPAGPPSDAFDAVVAGWRAEGGVPQWPDFDGPPRARERGAPEAERGEREPSRGDAPGDTTHSHLTRGDVTRGDTPPDDAPPDDALRGDALFDDTPPAAATSGEPTADDPPSGDPARGVPAFDGPALDGPALDGPALDGPAPGVTAGDGVQRNAAADPLDDDHFVPGEPPPLPRPALPIMVGLVLLAIGLVLVWAPGWIGVPQVYGLPLGLVGLAAGLGWLVLRLWPDPDGAGPPLGHDPDDPDDGAVL